MTCLLSQLEKQASMTAADYLNRAIEEIDGAFNEKGYAKKHPELVAKFMECCCRDFHSCCIQGTLAELSDTIYEHFFAQKK